MYYIADTILKHNQFGCELKLQSHSVIIECIDQVKPKVQCIITSNFNTLLKNSPNTFCGKYIRLFIALDSIIDL
jgi:hypothetical protein